MSPGNRAVEISSINSSRPSVIGGGECLKHVRLRNKVNVQRRILDYQDLAAQHRNVHPIAVRSGEASRRRSSVIESLEQSRIRQWPRKSWPIAAAAFWKRRPISLLLAHLSARRWCLHC